MDRQDAYNSPIIAALIVAAGRGTRAGGGTPKQYRTIGGEAVLARTLQVFDRHPRVTVIQPVIGAEDIGLYRHCIPESAGFNCPVSGGATRQASVLAGLETLGAAGSQPDYVLVHDAARPFVSEALIDRVIGALEAGRSAVIPGLPVTDTVKRVAPDGLIEDTVDRTSLRRVQTPQGFAYEALIDAHRGQAGVDMTDDAAVMEAAGHPVHIVDGDQENIKITNPEDFETAEARLTGARAPRTGFGFDVHRFEHGDGVILCGIEVPHTARLAGHSDADVGLHALTDAILGAIAEGDIGDHFPPSDPQWRGAPSDRFLAHAADLARRKGGVIDHVDVTLICERPKIGPHRAAMRQRIAGILGLDLACVSVKATTTERLGFTGRAEGIAAQAVATVRL